MAQSTMKAFVQTEGGPSSVLKLVEIPKPTPGPRDLLVKNRAVATNPVDYKVRGGFKPSETQSMRIVGWDAAGVVEAVGSEVQHYKVGDEVYYAGTILRPGCNSEYTVVDERIVGRKPNNFTWEQAAAIPLTGLTAWEALSEQMRITEPGTNATNEHKIILISGGAGGVGSIAIQLAKKIFKLKVIATASRPETVDFCKKMGADHTVDYKGDIEAQVKALGYQGVDYIFECFSLDTYFDTWLKILNPFGTICSIVEAKGPLPVGNLMRRRGTLTWELMFTRTIFNVEAERQRHVLNHLTDLCEAKVIDPRVTVQFDSMHKLKEAHDLQESGKAIGKISLTANF